MTIKDLIIGNTYSNNEIMEAFSCDNNRGIRVSLKTSSIVIINNFRRRKDTNPYKDTPMDEKGEIEYTGEGTHGDQKIIGGNKRIIESKTTGIRLYYFESYESNEYVYRGEVVYVDHKFINEPDIDNNLRKVIKFNLRIRNENDLIYVSEDIYEKQIEQYEKEVATKSENELVKLLKKQREVRINNVLSKQYYRDPVVKTYTLKRANGKCDLCEQDAPFITKSGEPYLESHHVKHLEDNGLDSISNTVALCPNCHKKVHFGKKESSDYKKMINVIIKYIINDINLSDQEKEFYLVELGKR